MSFIDVLKELFCMDNSTTTNTQTKQIPKGESNMLNELKDLFKKEVSLIQSCKLSAMVVNMLNEFNAELLKDGNSKDAAIDCMIKILEDEKSTAKKGS